MCNPKLKSSHPVAQIDGRLVLQPAGNRVTTIDPSRPLKKTNQNTVPPSSPTRDISNAASAPPATRKLSSPASPKLRTCKSMPVKRTIDLNSLSSSTEKLMSPKSAAKVTPVVKKKSKKSTTPTTANSQSVAIHNDLLFIRDGAPGSIAAAQREQASLRQAQRKLRIAHYGRIDGKVAPADTAAEAKQEEKRCSFITMFSDPLYIAYHDEEWGEPVHDDRMLFELLVLTGAQVGLDWALILRKRNDFREAFAGFDAEVVARFSERQIASISSKYGLDLGRVRGFVDNANRILEVKKAFGSLDKYLWGFVNHKAISTNYKFGRKIPVKTSKSESISKDLLRRGFRFVGPTVVHSFMQAAGLTNDHVVSCPRHLHCAALAATSSTGAN